MPEKLGATAQGIYATASAGIAMGLAMIVAGPLYAALAGKAFFVMAVVGLAGAFAGLALMRLNQRAAESIAAG